LTITKECRFYNKPPIRWLKWPYPLPGALPYNLNYGNYYPWNLREIPRFVDEKLQGKWLNGRPQILPHQQSPLTLYCNSNRST
jgi:hypothetical protein